jgi:hypothetical protein
MSQALASARRRRIPGSDPEPIAAPKQGISAPNFNPANGSSAAAPNGSATAAGLTLPQVIALVDKRLTSLEQITKESKPSLMPEMNVPSNLTEILDEFNARHELLANEIGSLKNVVMSLQSYTMDVNKMLLQERIKILSDFETPSESNEKED